MAFFNPITNFRTTLAQSMTSSQLTLVLSSITIQDHDLVPADYGVKVYFTINPGAANMEVVRATTNTGTTFTLDKRGLEWYGQGDVELSDFKFDHSAGEPVIISNVKNFQEQYVDTFTDQSVTGVKTFPSADASRIRLDSDTDTAVAAALVTFGQLSRQAIAGAANASTTVKGLVQLPTQSETDARTTTGSTGALLSVTPDVLRATKYIDFQASVVGTDSYAITPVPTVSALTDGQIYVFEADVANTGVATLAVGATGAKTIKKYGSVDLETGDIAAGSIVVVAYDLDSDTYMLQTAVAKQQITQDFREVFGGTSVVGTDAYAVTISPAPAAYAAGQQYTFITDVANTGAATLKVNALAAITIKKGVNSDLETGDIKAGQAVTVTFDGTNFQMVTQTAASASSSTSLRAHAGVTAMPADTNENTLVSASLPAGVLGTKNAIRVKFGYNSTGNGFTATLRIKYGSTTITSVTLPDSSTVTRFGTLDAWVMNTAVATQDFITCFVTSNSNSNGDAQTNNSGTSAVDTSGAITASVTIQTTNASMSINAWATIELVGGV